ncbi:hypothetical protein ACFL4D_02485 [Candidatus Margulisiibacteriota bacterium]
MNNKVITFSDTNADKQNNRLPAGVLGVGKMIDPDNTLVIKRSIERNQQKDPAKFKVLTERLYRLLFGDYKGTIPKLIPATVLAYRRAKGTAQWINFREYLPALIANNNSFKVKTTMPKKLALPIDQAIVYGLLTDALVQQVLSRLNVKGQNVTVNVDFNRHNASAFELRIEVTKNNQALEFPGNTLSHIDDPLIRYITENCIQKYEASLRKAQPGGKEKPAVVFTFKPGKQKHVAGQIIKCLNQLKQAADEKKQAAKDKVSTSPNNQQAEQIAMVRRALTEINSQLSRQNDVVAKYSNVLWDLLTSRLIDVRREAGSSTESILANFLNKIKPIIAVYALPYELATLEGKIRPEEYLRRLMMMFNNDQDFAVMLAVDFPETEIPNIINLGLLALFEVTLAKQHIVGKYDVPAETTRTGNQWKIKVALQPAGKGKDKDHFEFAVTYESPQGTHKNLVDNKPPALTFNNRLVNFIAGKHLQGKRHRRPSFYTNGDAVFDCIKFHPDAVPKPAGLEQQQENPDLQTLLTMLKAQKDSLGDAYNTIYENFKALIALLNGVTANTISEIPGDEAATGNDITSFNNTIGNFINTIASALKVSQGFQTMTFKGYYEAIVQSSGVFNNLQMNIPAVKFSVNTAIGCGLMTREIIDFFRANNKDCKLSISLNLVDRHENRFELRINTNPLPADSNNIMRLALVKKIMSTFFKQGRLTVDESGFVISFQDKHANLGKPAPQAR